MLVSNPPQIIAKIQASIKSEGEEDNYLGSNANSELSLDKKTNTYYIVVKTIELYLVSTYISITLEVNIVNLQITKLSIQDIQSSNNATIY